MEKLTRERVALWPVMLKLGVAVLEAEEELVRSESE